MTFMMGACAVLVMTGTARAQTAGTAGDRPAIVRLTLSPEAFRDPAPDASRRAMRAMAIVDREPVRRTPPLVQMPTYGWAGMYVGGQAGPVSGSADLTTSVVYDTSGYFASSSVDAINDVGGAALEPGKLLFGGQVGALAESGTFVYGGEADFAIMKLSEEQEDTVVYPCCPGTSFTLTQSVETSWMLTLRGRAGVAFGPALAYGTAGLAFTNVTYLAALTDTFANAREDGGVDETRRAFAFGGGIEVRGGPHWSIRGEFLRADFGEVSADSTNLTTGASTTWPENVFTHTMNLTLNVFRGAINIGF